MPAIDDVTLSTIRRKLSRGSTLTLAECKWLVELCKQHEETITAMIPGSRDVLPTVSWTDAAPQPKGDNMDTSERRPVVEFEICAGGDGTEWFVSDQNSTQWLWEGRLIDPDELKNNDGYYPTRAAAEAALAEWEAKQSPTQPPAMPALEQERAGAGDFRSFSAANLARCEAVNGFNHPLNSWSLSDWFTAILGELGEAANIAKKLNRVRDGIRGNKETEAELRDKLKREIADTFIYLDLTAQAAGFLLSDAAVETFNAKSKEVGYPVEYVPTTAHAAEVAGLRGEIAALRARLDAAGVVVEKCDKALSATRDRMHAVARWDADDRAVDAANVSALTAAREWQAQGEK